MKNGIHKDLTREAYDALTDRENWSIISEAETSLLHYKYRKTAPPEEKAVYVRGNALHCLVFEPKRFWTDYAVWHSARRGKSWDEFEATHVKQSILTADEFEKVEGMAKSLRAHPLVAPHLADGSPEVSVLWTHKGEGFEMDCKSRLDWVAPTTGAILDIKTTSRGVGLRDFGRSCADYGYHGQAAMYSDGFEAASGIRLPYFLVAVEAAAPFDVCVYRVTGVELELGRAKYQSYLQRIAEARKANHWPGQSSVVRELVLPVWALEGVTT